LDRVEDLDLVNVDHAGIDLDVRSVTVVDGELRIP
jgi:hypothetical protein